MKAVVVKRPNGLEVLEVVPNHPIPRRSPKHVLVKLTSTSVNPIDTYVRRGQPMPTAGFPKVLGGDVAGVVADADDSSKFKTGEPVYALTTGYMHTQEGSYAHYASVPEDWLARVPPNLPLDQAGGVPLVALTAWQALEPAQPSPGQRLLVFAGAGGVGHMAVQMGVALGLHVATVLGPANVDFAKEELGAHEVLDYTKADFVDAFKDAPFDIVVDSRPQNALKCLSVLKPSGCYSHIYNAGTDPKLLEQLEADAAAGKGPRVVRVLVQPSGEQLTKVSDLIAAGKVKLVVYKSLPLEQAAEGHKQVETGHTRGKVVLTID